MFVQCLHAPSKERVTGLAVLCGLALAGVVLQRRLQARVLLSQPILRTGLVGLLGVAETITALALVSSLALLTAVLALHCIAPSLSLMNEATANGIVRLITDSGGTLAVFASMILAWVAYSGRRSAFLTQLRRSRDEYLFSLKSSIALTRTQAGGDDDSAIRTLRDVIRGLEDQFADSLSCRPNAVEEHDALHDALTRATEELVARELKRRISHIDVYGEEILNGPQNHRGGHLRHVWRSRLGYRNLMRAFGIAGRTLFASGLSLVYVSVLLVALNQGPPSIDGKTDQAVLGHHDLRPSSLAPDLVVGPPTKEHAAPASDHADQVAHPSVEAPPEVLFLEIYRERSAAIEVGRRRADAPARHHPARLRRIHRALVAKDSFAVALILIEWGRMSEGRRILRRLAENGNRDAALALGSTYDPSAIEGHQARRYKPDPRRAVYWYRKAHPLDR